MSGHKMIQSDALSRRPDLCPTEDNDNENITLLGEELFVNLIDTELQREIANAKDLDMDAANALKLLLEQGPNALTSDLEDWTTMDLDGTPMLFYQGKHYIPKNDTLRRKIVEKFHNPTTAGHPGKIATYNDIAKYYWWPGMQTFV